jgi:hypothetical protein
MQNIDTNINFRENPSGRFHAASYGQKDGLTNMTNQTIAFRICFANALKAARLALLPTEVP